MAALTTKVTQTLAPSEPSLSTPSVEVEVGTAVKIASLEALKLAFREIFPKANEAKLTRAIERLMKFAPRVTDITAAEDESGSIISGGVILPIPSGQRVLLLQKQGIQTGGCKRICHGVDLTTGVHVAVGVADPSQAKPPLEPAALKMQIEREVYFAERLSGKGAHILQIPYTMQQGDHTFFVMDYHSTELRECIDDMVERAQDGESVELDERVGLALGAARALQEVHAQKIIHRDINPQNFLMNREGQVRICDFGAAVEMGKFKALGFCGTPRYLAPELINASWEGDEDGSKIDKCTTPAADIWSLGVMIHEILTLNQLPWEVQDARASKSAVIGKTICTIRELPRDWSPSLPKSIHPKIAALLSKMLKVNPADRCSIDEVVACLSALNEELTKQAAE